MELLLLIAVGLYCANREEINLQFTQEELIDDTGSAAFYLDRSTSSQYVASPGVILPKGMYTLEAECESAGTPKLRILYQEAKERYHQEVSGDIPIEGTGTVSCDFRVSYADRALRVKGLFTEPAEEGEYLLIRNIRIKTADSAVRNTVFRAAVLLLVLNAVFFIIWQKKRGNHLFFEKYLGEPWKALALIALFASLPLMVDYLFLDSHDLYFHLMRIEGIRAGLEGGMFPVRVQPWWLNGHGYAASIFYGDFFLYVPALLRYFGVSVQTAYKCYVVMINILTVGISYYSFRKMSRQKIGLVCTALYSLNLYRLTCIYTRAAVGEYTAMTFMPLVLYGLWKLYMLPEDSEEHRDSWLTLTIGCTGIFLSHMITTEITAAFIVLSAIILWKRIFRKKTMLVGLKTVAATVLLNLWFLVPFLDYMANGTYEISTSTFSPYRIEKTGVMVSQLFLGGYTVFGYSKSVSDGGRGEMPLTVGIALMAVFCGWIILCAGKKERKDTERKTDRLAVFLCFLSLFLATCLFPYSGLAKFVPLFGYAINSVQYAWRFLSVAALFLTWLLCLTLQKEWISAEKRRIFAGLLAVLSLYQGAVYMGDCMKEAVPYRVYQAGNMSTMETQCGMDIGQISVMGGEYLPFDKSHEFNRVSYMIACVDTLSYDETCVSVEGWERDQAAVLVTLHNDSENVQQVEVPLLFYKGYHAVTDGGEQLDILPGTAYRIAVSIPAGFSGRVRVAFKEPGCWRVCEIVSLLMLVVLILRVFGLHGRRGRGDRGVRKGA